MSNGNQQTEPSDFLMYKTEDDQLRIEIRMEDETVWLNQKQMAQLFQKDVRTINEHLQNTYFQKELFPEATIRKFRIVRTEGRRQVARQVDFYNLDMIISVGYRVKSLIATRFRIWATERLKEYIVKGFTMDDERLKNPPVAGSFAPDYFDEMLERIRDIRASNWNG